jgi:hypothetical protein
MMNALLSLCLFSLIQFQLVAQVLPKPSYHSPLAIPLRLSANFGEIRPNHFHMGVDFKTNGIEGLSLFSIEDGYVSRIKTSPYGYGKVIYINHPNGITSVYAHCSSFEGKIDSLVRSVQFQQESTEIDVYFTPEDLKVTKGQRIARSGNTGSSTAPHLHFELRDTKTEEALNPLVFGFDIPDHKTPTLNSVKLYVVDENGYTIPGKSYSLPINQVGKSFVLSGGGFTLEADCCALNEFVGLALNGVDTYDGAQNLCGLYQTTLLNAQNVVFGQQIDRISFDDSRYVNSHTDYEEYKTHKYKYHKAFRTKHNPLTIYNGKDLGLLGVMPGDSLSLSFQVKDIKENKANIQFFLRRKKGEIPLKKQVFTSSDYFFPDSSYSFSTELFHISSEPFTFYIPTKKNLSLARVYSFGDPQSPIQRPLSVKMKLNDPKSTNYYIQVTTRNGVKEALKPTVNNGWIESTSLYLGTFSLVQDTQAPRITPLNFNPTQSNQSKKTLSFRISENGSGIKYYNAYVDGRWLPIEYESKGDYLLLDIPSECKGKRVNLRVESTDYCSNIGVWEMIIEL